VVGLDRGNEAMARKMGATDYLTVKDDPAAKICEMTGGAGADVVFEAAGSEKAVVLALDLARRGGTVILSGIAGDGRRMSVDSDLFALKDLRIDGVFAYTTDSFEQALRIIESGRLDVRPLVTHTLPLHEFEKAFDLLSNRPAPVGKVMLKP
jgi:threonine dehydrogenase-like Zn-dependent dehydrogenase